MTAVPKLPMKKGPRPGMKRGGKPKGYIFPKTLEKLEGKARLRELVLRNLDPIVLGLIAKARGVNHMMLRDPETGQWVRLTEVEQIEAALNAPGAEEGKTFWVHTKDPDVAAASDILNRAIGKPIEEVDIQARVAHAFKWISD
mgnify:CR=1 FL=1